MTTLIDGYSCFAFRLIRLKLGKPAQAEVPNGHAIFASVKHGATSCACMHACLAQHFVQNICLTVTKALMDKVEMLLLQCNVFRKAP